MYLIWQVMREQLHNLDLILRLGWYEVKSLYKMHYLGVFWQVLSPLIQISIYWFVFGLGIRGGSPIGEIPFFLWLLVGLVPWLFISPTIVQGASSVHSNINLVAKMKFPVSVLPAIKLVRNSFSFLMMLLITLILLGANGFFSGWYLLQLPYYLVSLYFLLFGITLLLSTLTTIIRDIQTVVQSVMRLMLYMLPILWNVENLPKVFVHLLELNPFYYIIEGFRFSLLGGSWFFDHPSYTVYFWLLSLFIILLGSTVHLKFRHKFVDYL